MSNDTSSASLVAAVRDPKTVFWLDMFKPTDEEFALLDDVFGFHPLAIEDSIGYSQRPKIESYNHVGDACSQGYFYMVFHGPDLETFREHLRTKEVDMFVSERYLVTIHDEEMRSVGALLQRAEVDARIVLDPGIDMLLHNILDHMTDGYVPILDHVQEVHPRLEPARQLQPVAQRRLRALAEIGGNQNRSQVDHRTTLAFSNRAPR